MKRQLTVALGLLVVAAPAFATKARLEALGEDNFGSYYINDNRNIFLNPARINENKDFVTFEFGAAGQNVTAADSASAPRAVGGFAKSHGNMVYGLHFGDSSPSAGLVRSLTTQANGLQEVQPWDFHIGGDAGVKWGASLTYENFDQSGAGGGSRHSSNGLRLRGGALMGDLDVFAHVSLSNDAKGDAGREIDGKMGLFLGAGYMLNNYKLFADWRMVGAEYRDPALTTGRDDIDVSIIRVGAGRQERLNDRATLFAKAMIVRTNTEDDGGASIVQGGGPVSTVGADVEQYILPVSVGLEFAATSWLDLRASVVNNVWSKSEVDPKVGSKSSNHLANTAIRAGASLKFGEFSIDGLIGTDSAGGGTPAQTDGSVDNGGNIRTDNLMTRVAMIYRF